MQTTHERRTTLHKQRPTSILVLTSQPFMWKVLYFVPIFRHGIKKSLKVKRTVLLDFHIAFTLSLLVYSLPHSLSFLLFFPLCFFAPLSLLSILSPLLILFPPSLPLFSIDRCLPVRVVCVTDVPFVMLGRARLPTRNATFTCLV